MHNSKAAASIHGSIKQDCQTFKFLKLVGEIFYTSRVVHPYGKCKMAKSLLFLRAVLFHIQYTSRVVHHYGKCKMAKSLLFLRAVLFHTQ